MSHRGGPRGRGRGGDGDRGGHRGGPPRGGGGYAGGGRGRGGPPSVFRENQPVQVDARLANNAEAKAVAAFKNVPYDPIRPLRPGYGTLGQPILLRANFFALRLPKGPWYEYAIEITPSTDINRIKARLFQLLERSPQCQPFLSHIAHDGSKKLVSAKKLPEPLDIQIPFVEDGANAPLPGHTTYNMHFSFAQELKLSELSSYLSGNVQFAKYNPAPIISATQLVVTQHSARTALRVGTSRYFSRTPDQRSQLSQAVFAFQGFYASVRPSYNQLAVNINACMGAFITAGRLDEMLLAFSRNSKGAMPNLPPKLAKAIQVTTHHLGYKKKNRIKRIGTTSARDTRFSCTDFGGKEATVEEFFLKKYKKKLQHPTDLPVIDIAGPTKHTPVWIPAELCTIELQAYGEKLSPEETANMIRVACRPPAVNAEETVNRGLPQLAFTPSTTNAATSPLSGFGIEVRQEHATVPARILPAPSLTYSKGRPTVRGGAWNIVDVQFHRGGAIKNWWALYVRDGPPHERQLFQGPDDQRFQGLLQGFINKCKTSGMRVENAIPLRLFTPPLPGPNHDPGRVQAVNIIRTLIKESGAKYGKPTFILVLLSREDDFIYPGIKRIGDVELGVHTLHMLLKDGRNALGEPNKADQYFSNIALKLNTKLGGINHRLDEASMRWLTKRPTMMVGIDVTHPSPRSRPGTPSIAAVVASVDQDFVHFPCSLRLQKKSKKEMVDDLEMMMVERLQGWKAKNKILPEKIIVFRDGVSEGQYDVVLNEELPLIFSACKKAGGAGKPYRPQLSVIICGKRHHARFPATSQQQVDRSGNTLPGTIVDQGVSNIFDYDFYLQAHAGLQGTARPTHYVVIYDESRLGVDELQQGTHTASYAYARATKAVSLIPPAYYADLACERGRCYLNDFLNLEEQTTTSSKRGKKDKEEEEKRVFEMATKAWGNGVHDALRPSMFYL